MAFPFGPQRNADIFVTESQPPFTTQGVKDNCGCMYCRLRKKRCTSSLGTRCHDCEKFNLGCGGQGTERPTSGEDLEYARTTMKSWIHDKSNRQPGIAPLDLSFLWMISPTGSSAQSAPPTISSPLPLPFIAPLYAPPYGVPSLNDDVTGQPDPMVNTESPFINDSYPYTVEEAGDRFNAIEEGLFLSSSNAIDTGFPYQSVDETPMLSHYPRLALDAANGCDGSGFMGPIEAHNVQDLSYMMSDVGISGDAELAQAHGRWDNSYLAIPESYFRHSGLSSPSSVSASTPYSDYSQSYQSYPSSSGYSSPIFLSQDVMDTHQLFDAGPDLLHER